MKRLCPRQAGSADFTVPDKSSLERFLQENEIEFDEDYTVRIGGSFYKIRLEGWFPDCLESRDLGETNQSAIRQYYKEIMEVESGWTANIHGYMPNYPGTEYGVSYIGEEL